MVVTAEYPGLSDDGKTKENLAGTMPYQAVAGRVDVVIGKDVVAAGQGNAAEGVSVDPSGDVLVEVLQGEMRQEVAGNVERVSATFVPETKVPETRVFDSAQLEKLSTICYFDVQVLSPDAMVSEERLAYPTLVYREDFHSLLLAEFGSVRSLHICEMVTENYDHFACEVPVEWLKGLVDEPLPDHGKVKVLLSRKPLPAALVDEGSGFNNIRRRVLGLTAEADFFHGHYLLTWNLEAQVSSYDRAGAFVVKVDEAMRDDFEAIVAGEFPMIKNEELKRAVSVGKRLIFDEVPIGWIPCFFPGNKPTVMRLATVLMTPSVVAVRAKDSPVEKYRSSVRERRAAARLTAMGTSEASEVVKEPVDLQQRLQEVFEVDVGRYIRKLLNEVLTLVGKPADAGLRVLDWIFAESTPRAILLFLVLAGGAVGAIRFLGAEKGRAAVGTGTVVSSGESVEEDEIEVLKGPKKPLAVLLENAARVFNPADYTKSDRMLKMDRVIEHLLAGKFKYIATDPSMYPSTRDGNPVQGSVKQEVYRFAMIGKLSGHTTADPKSVNAYQTTTLADAVNTLLEPGLSDNQLKTWICWFYEASFGVKLQKERLGIVKDNKGVFTMATYNPEPGFAPKGSFYVIQQMDAREGSEPGGSYAKTPMDQPLLGANNRLLLPSGVSPYCDVRVPASLLKSDPKVTLKLGGRGVWQIAASYISKRIEDLEERMAQNPNRNITINNVFGKRDITVAQMAPLIDTADPMAKQLVDFVLTGIDKNDHPKRILTIIDFVQQLGYRYEYDSNFDRPGLLVLFNEGGDCNNVEDFYAQLMAAAGYDSAVMWVAFDNNQSSLHARGGVPAKYFSGYKGRKWPAGEKGEAWIPIELTGKVPLGQETWGQHETTFHIEVVRAPKPVEAKGKGRRFIEVDGKRLETFEVVVPDGKSGWKKLGDSK